MLYRPTAKRTVAPYTDPVKAAPTDRKPADRSNQADRHVERQARERRSGEGAASALANLKSIELDRQRTRTPEEEEQNGDGD